MEEFTRNMSIAVEKACVVCKFQVKLGFRQYLVEPEKGTFSFVPQTR
jgi:hypothetical protein